MNWLTFATWQPYKLNRTFLWLRRICVRPRAACVLLLGALVWLIGVVILESIGFALTDDWRFHLIYSALFTFVMGWLLLPHRPFRLAPAANDMIIRGMKDAVFVLDAQSKIVVANPAAAQLLASPETELIGQPLRQFSADWAAHVGAYQQTQEVSSEIVLHQGEAVLHYDVRISPLRTYWGTMNRRVVIVRDITSRQVATQQAAQLVLEQEKVKLLREFIDTTSHDLNTPLTTLRISTDLLLVYTNRLQSAMTKLRLLSGNNTSAEWFVELEQLSKSVATNGNRVNDSTLRLQRLVSDMLELVRLDKQLSLDLFDENLNDLGRQVIADDSASAVEKNVAIRYEPDLKLPLVSFDLSYVKLALHHLLRNAVTYTPAGGTITLRTYRQADWAVMEVSDTGLGIPATDLPYVFDRYYRVDKSRSTNTGGMGLGLAIAKKIIEAHQGQIEAESVLGQGSSFRIRLPMQADSSLASWHPNSYQTAVAQPVALPV